MSTLITETSHLNDPEASMEGTENEPNVKVNLCVAHQDESKLISK